MSCSATTQVEAVDATQPVGDHRRFDNGRRIQRGNGVSRVRDPAPREPFEFALVHFVAVYAAEDPQQRAFIASSERGPRRGRDQFNEAFAIP
jgi:hypothetical protein